MIGGAADSKTLTYRVAGPVIVGNGRFSIALPECRMPDATAGLATYPYNRSHILAVFHRT